MYNFGVYHWRRRGRRIVLGSVAMAAGALGVRRSCSTGRTLGVASLVVGCWTAGRPALELARSPPWSISTEKYAALADALPLDSADRVLDVGCGTGRSLVGLAPAIRPDATVVAVDVFDDRIILGNGPQLARRNAARAGVTVSPVRGDAARLPVVDRSVDVVTACRLLHDLTKADARRTLAEARRVLTADGTLGVLALPIPHDEGVEPGPYWRGLVEEAGFSVTSAASSGDEYFVFAATPG